MLWTLAVGVAPEVALAATPDEGAPARTLQLPPGAEVVTIAPPARHDGPSGLDSTLAQIASAFRSGSRAKLASFAGQRFVDLKAGAVRVILEMDDDPDAH